MPNLQTGGRGAVRFGEFELIPASGELLRDGSRVPLQGQPLGVLIVLIADAGNLVTRERLREELWPGGVHVDFEHGLNTAVRRLREALGDNADAPRFIETLPRRGYRFIAPVAAAPGGERTDPLSAAVPIAEHSSADSRRAGGTPPSSSAPAAFRGRPSRRAAFAAVGVLVLAVAVLAGLRLVRRTPPPLPRLVQLAPAREALGATFSPDGSQVAFQSLGEQDAEWHVWVKIVGDAESRRLTTDPEPECCPAWSPDGKQIAVVKGPPGSQGVELVSPTSGAGRRLLEFPVAGLLSWSPDGRWIAAARERAANETTPESGGIHLIPSEGGEPHAVTFPAPPRAHQFPAFSPDGRQLAYAACDVAESHADCDVYVLPLDPQARPRAAARRLTWRQTWIFGLAWTRDGRSIVWGSGLELNFLWRVPADGSSPPERVELAGNNAYAPSTARGQDRLAFSRTLFDSVIYRLALGGAPAPLIDSASRDLNAQYSPDGRRIAFASRRSGDRNEIWLVDADGASPTRLTRGSARFRGSPRWSPDGRTIAFDAWSDEGQWDIWTIGVDGAGLRRVTHDPVKAHIPSFSRDGRWIYFTSHRTGREEVWRVAIPGGQEEQVTRTGGTSAFESPDGRTLFYLRSAGGALLARSTGGGVERTVASCVNLSSYAVAPTGIFYVSCNVADAAARSQHVLHYWNARTGQDGVVGGFEAPTTLNLAVSPDGRTLLYDRSTPGSDLMMIENFR